MNCNTTHYRANSSSVPGDPTDEEAGLTPGRPLRAERQLFGAHPLDVPDEQTSDYKIAQWAAQELKKPQSKPLFLACGFFRPHIPWEVPQKWFDRVPLDSVQLPPHRDDDLDDAFDHGRQSWHKWVVENNLWEKFVQGYLASTEYVDAQIGIVLDALDQSALKNNTVVVLWTDHGFHLGEKQNWEKFTLWERSTRVPLLFSGPGIPSGSKCDRTASLVDLYPTLSELAGLETPKQCDGLSLVPQLRNPQASRDRAALTTYAFGKELMSHAVRDDRYRYIRYHNGFEELYDLQDDPNEYTNRAKDEALTDVRSRLALELPKDTAPVRQRPKTSSYDLPDTAE